MLKYWLEAKLTTLQQNISEGSALEERTKSVMTDTGLDWEDRSSTEKKRYNAGKSSNIIPPLLAMREIILVRNLINVNVG